MENSEITFNEHGFIISGKHLLLISGEMHYMRIPPELYHDRMVKLKVAGLNAVATYVAWNYHEPREGVWNEEAQRKLISFIETAKKLGLFVILRIGPYICSEWDGGGFPGWVLARCYPRRPDDSEYLKLTKEWYSRIIKLIKGFMFPNGPVIALQVENEYWWGDREYILALYNMLKDLGVKIPIITNENIACRNTGVIDSIDLYPDPWDFKTPLERLEELKKDEKGKPCIVMELGGGWFTSRFGRLPTDRGSFPPEWTERLLKILVAKGASIINIYMFHGGTNPVGYTGKGIITSYDYEAAIREWGGLSQRYYKIKRALNVIRTFERTLLLGKREDINITDEEVKATLISDNENKLLLIWNTSAHRKAILIDVGSIVLEPYDVRLIPYDVSIGNIRLKSNCEVVYKYSSNDYDIVILHTKAGNTVRIRLKGITSLIHSDVNVLFKKGEVVVEDIFTGELSVIRGKAKDKDFLIYICSEDMSERLFLINDNIIVLGPCFAYGKVEGKEVNVDVLINKDACIRILPLIREPSFVKIEDGEYSYDPTRCILIIHLRRKKLPKLSITFSEWNVRELDLEELTGRGGRIPAETRLEEAGFTDNGLYIFSCNFNVPHVWGRDILITNVVDEADLIINGTYIGRIVGSLRMPASDYIKLGRNKVVALLECVGRSVRELKILNGIGGLYLIAREDIPIKKVRLMQTNVIEISRLREVPKEAEEGYDDSEWDESIIPIVKDIKLRGKTAIWIRTSIDMSIEEKVKGVLLEIKGEGDFWIYVNGKFVRHIQLGCVRGYDYTVAHVDISEYIRNGKNVIAIYAERWWHWSEKLRIEALKLIKYLAKVDEWLVRPIDLVDIAIYGVEKQCKIPDLLKRSLIRLYECKVTIKGIKGNLIPIKLKIDGFSGKGILFFNRRPIGRYSTDSPQREFYIPEPLIKEDNVLHILHIGNDPFLTHIEIEPYQVLDMKKLSLSLD